jgi:hypothetical protein
MGPGKLLMGGVREFGYLRPQNCQICVHKFGYLGVLLVGLCPKFWVFEGRFLLSWDKYNESRALAPDIFINHVIHEATMATMTAL